MTEKPNIIKDNILKLFFRYAAPSVISMLGISLYVLADTFFIANGVGELGLTALNIVLPIYSIINGLGLLIGVGGATVLSISRAEDDHEAHRDIFTLSLLIAMLPALLFLLSGLFYSDKIVLFLGASANAQAYSTEYIRVILILAPVFMLNHIVTAFVRNDYEPRLAMVAMLAGVGFNIVFDYVLIYITGWGMFGAALATGFSPIVGLLVLSWHFIGKNNSFSIKKIRFQWSLMNRVIKGGMATFITELSSGIVILSFNYTILGMLGDLGVAAYGIIANIAFVCIALFIGIGQGLQPLVSSNFGAGRNSRCRKLLHAGLISSLLLSILFVACAYAFPEEIANVFNKDNNVALTRLAAKGIPLYFLSFLFAGMNVVIIYYYQAVLNSRTSIGLSLIRGLFGILAGLAILPRFWGTTGLWLTVPFAELITLVVAFVVLVRQGALTGQAARG